MMLRLTFSIILLLFIKQSIFAQSQKKQIIKVSIVDTGIDLENKKLAPYISRESRDFTNSQIGLQDEHGHGTHIASLIVDRSGLSPQELQIVILKYYSKTQTASQNLSSSTKALRYANQIRSQLVNYSAGGPLESQEEKQALSELSQSGILLIAAAGNEKSDADLNPFYPASYGLQNILSVGAHDSQFQRIESSNYGSRSVHISSFGKNILADIPGNQKRPLTGTSQATAIVTALIARLMTDRPDLKSPEQIKEHVLKTAEYKESLKDLNTVSGTFNLQRSLSMRSRRVPALFDAQLVSEENF